ncbi:MAG: hypothetical protein WAZ12_02520 [Candidatus Absconditicoccaceae bacterium]
MENIIISDQKKLDREMENIIHDGISNLWIISDFDRTFTKAFVKGKPRASLLSILRDENYLTPDYSAKAQALFDYYHRIEMDLNVDIETKKKFMLERWTKHFQLLIQSGLSKQDIQQAIQSENIEFREGALGLFDLSNEYNIPLVIFSASGLGYDGIYRYLKKFNKLYKNIHIASNTFQRDRDGYALDIQKPIIHSFNKDAHTLFNLPFYKEIKDRKNVVLLGDTIGDSHMIDGFEYKNLIKIGFLNDKIAPNLEEYKKSYDIIITDDGSLNYVDRLIKKLINN